MFTLYFVVLLFSFSSEAQEAFQLTFATTWHLALLDFKARKQFTHCKIHALTYRYEKIDGEKFLFKVVNW